MECEREKESLLSDVRQMDKELSLQALVIDSYIPREYQELIEQHAVWDEESGEWHLVQTNTHTLLFCMSYSFC